jgi:broad specificity phosphatase PhoE
MLVGALALALLTAIGCGESCSCNNPLPEAPEVTVYIIRHAEKQAPAEAGMPADEDPPLSAEGQLRAMGLVDDIPVKDIDAVYVTKTRRSHDTASAVLAVTGIEPVIYPPKDTPGLVERLRKRHGQQVLVVGHSNTIPPLLHGLGLNEPVEIAEDQYGDLWIVTLNADGATLETRKYGESLERFDSGR